MSPSTGNTRETIGTKVVLLVTYTFAATTLLMAAVALWGMSALRLHAYGEDSVLVGWIGRVMLPAIGWWDVHPGAIAWALPAGIDFAGLALSIVIAVMAFLYGHPMTPLRLMLVLVTGVSAMINRWETPIINGDGGPKLIATIIPLLAVLTFEGFVYALRKLHELRTGKAHARIHPARWLFDFPGTWDIVRTRVLAIPLPGEHPSETMARLAGQTAPGPAESTRPVPVRVRRSLRELAADLLDAARRSLAAEPVRVVPLPYGHDSARPGPAALARPGSVTEMLARPGPARPGPAEIASSATPAEALNAAETTPAEQTHATPAQTGPARPSTPAEQPAASPAHSPAEAGPARPGPAEHPGQAPTASPADTTARPGPATLADQVTARPEAGPAEHSCGAGDACPATGHASAAEASGPARPGPAGDLDPADTAEQTRPGPAQDAARPAPAASASPARPGPAGVSSHTESGPAGHPETELEQTRPMPRLAVNNTGQARPDLARPTPIREQASPVLVEAAVAAWIEAERQMGRDDTLAKLRELNLSVPHRQRQSLMDEARRLYDDLAKTG